MRLVSKEWQFWVHFAIYWFFSASKSVDNGENELSFSIRQEVARRTQRDISKSVPIDQATSLGASLSNLLFGLMGYTSYALPDVADMLDNGIETLLIDLYWNEFTNKWQLCPAPFPRNSTHDIYNINKVYWEGKEYRCQPSMTAESLFGTIKDYVRDSNSVVDVNVLQLILRLNSIHQKGNSTSASIYKSPNPEFERLGNSQLNNTLSSLYSYLYTPRDLSLYNITCASDIEYKGFYNQSNYQLPSHQELLFNENKRVLIHVYDDLLESSNKAYNITSNDRAMMFFPNSSILSMNEISNSTVEDECYNLLNDYNSDTYTEHLNNISLRTHFRFMADSPEMEFTNETLAQYVRCGYSPILNGSNYGFLEGTNYNEESDREAGKKGSQVIDDILLQFLPLSFWSWNPYQPQSSIRQENSSDSMPENSNKKQVAYKCVVAFEDGWSVGNCYNQFLYACQNNNSPNNFTISDDRKRYFEAYDDNKCPAGYQLATPKSSIEMLGLISAIKAENLSHESIWIDLSDITITNCYVTGGPYADCPYQRTISRSRLVRLIAPSFVVIVVILILIFLEKFFRPSPILTSRKHKWRRIVNEYNEKFDYEGVPS